MFMNRLAIVALSVLGSAAVLGAGYHLYKAVNGDRRQKGRTETLKPSSDNGAKSTSEYGETLVEVAASKSDEVQHNEVFQRYRKIAAHFGRPSATFEGKRYIYEHSRIHGGAVGEVEGLAAADFTDLMMFPENVLAELEPGALEVERPVLWIDFSLEDRPVMIFGDHDFFFAMFRNEAGDFVAAGPQLEDLSTLGYLLVALDAMMEQWGL